jgi:UDP-glucose 4-epimerase
MRNYSDTSKAARMLGWHSEMDLKEGLQHTVDWFMNQSEDQ